MMEHVRQFDWCTSISEKYFVDEADIDNCNTEKILRNKFFDPLLSNSESEEEDLQNNIDWDKIFKNRQIRKNKLFIPCLRPVPPYPKLSNLNSKQHHLFIQVLSAENPDVLQDLELPRPTKFDIKTFQAAQDIYQAEQKEYIEWAHSLWTTDHCIRALRPKPAVETVYEAEFKVRAQRMRSLPKYYDIAAQIPLESRIGKSELVLKEELISVNLSDIPQVQVPENIDTQFCILKPGTVTPEPCQKHPYQFILPNEDSVSILPLTEIHRELALYAVSHGTQYIASENALKCLMQLDRYWTFPLSVCDTIGPDGEKVNVVVLDSEFCVHKEAAPLRTLRAFRHLLEHALIPSSEREELLERSKNTDKKKNVASPRKKSIVDNVDMSSDDEDSNLYIDTENDVDMDNEENVPESQQSKNKKPEDTKNRTRSVDLDSVGYFTRAVSRRISEEVHDIGVYSCTCKDSFYEIPPRRSFKKWQLRNRTSHESHHIIIHCPHKTRDTTGEVIVEPIPEYQLDLGASKQTDDSIRSVALSLMLRQNANVLNVRVDGPTGDVAKFTTISSEQFLKQHSELAREVPTTIQATLSQLQGLLPGHYVLLHEASHGANALLLSPRPASVHHKLVLNFDSSLLVDPDESKAVKKPPTITDEFLPYHKLRRTLPCAFTPYANLLMVSKEPKKPGPKKKAPPPAIKWPKKKARRKK